MTAIHLFPGQGSQKLGMGEDLFPRYPDLVRCADDLLGYSIADLCLRDPEQRLNLTQFTQPALFTVNAMTSMALFESTGIIPDVVAGHSLGEYNALLAADCFDFATGLSLVKQRGEAMAAAKGGAMAAVIGLPSSAIAEILIKNDLSSLDIANYNTPEQTVLAGPAADIARAEACCKAAGAKLYVPLKVSAAFHSRYMQEASERFSKVLDQATLQTPTLPVIANVSARPYQPGQEKANLAAQLRSSVRWSDTIAYCLALGDPTFTEVGPGRVLTGMLRQFGIR